MIANVQSSLRTAALFTGDDLAALLKVVNHQAYVSSAEGRYAALFYGVFDGSTRTLRYVNAGHNPSVVIRRDGSFKVGGSGISEGAYLECWCGGMGPLLHDGWRAASRRHRPAPQFYGSYQKTAPLVIVGRVKSTESPWRTP
jgi:hypothetical protein